MNVLHLQAVQFIQPMSTGRTRPLLLGCEDASGKNLEVVVKLRGREMGVNAQIAELMAAQLADDLKLNVPVAAVVDIPAGFEKVVADSTIAASIKASSGENFGSLHLGAGFTTWPAERSPHGEQRDQAASIFAFDTLVQNPDRRKENPNLWARSDRIGVYDHEQAFSFLFMHIFGGPSLPWSADSQSSGFRFLYNHIFYSSLRGSRVDLDSFEDKLGSLSDEKIAAYVKAVPKHWKTGNDLCTKISEYLTAARQNRQTLVNFIKHILR